MGSERCDSVPAYLAAYVAAYPAAYVTAYLAAYVAAYVALTWELIATRLFTYL